MVGLLCFRRLMYHKLVRAEVKAVNEAKGEVDAVVSSEKVDRSGDVIRQDFWDLKNFRRHPVLLAGHDYRLLTSQIGEWKNVRIEDKQLIGTAVYYVGQGNEQADWGFQLAMSGKAAYSVGFIPDMTKAKRVKPKPYKDGEESSSPTSGWEFSGQELLEVSQVTIPANSQALQRLYVAEETEPEVLEIIGEMLKDQELPAINTLSETDTEKLIELIAERVEVRLTPLIQEAVMSVFMRGAIPSHETRKADEDTEWDAGVEVRQAEGRSELRRMHTYVEDDGDPEAKSSYKLPHHKADGTVVWTGVAAAMAALMGARGGIDVPDESRRGIYDHLRRHYAQFDKQPPELRTVERLGGK
jgi:hypothetical protein